MTSRRVRVLLRWPCAVLLLTGVAGSVTAVPAVRDRIWGRPEPVQLPFRGESVVDVPSAGRYAIWATRPTTAPDADRCTVPGSSGMSAPGTVLQWVEAATDDTVWTWTATFTATVPGQYRLDCARDPGSPGQRYTVTPAPSGRLHAYLLWQRYVDLAIVALIAGVVLAVVLLVRRRPARIAPDGPTA